MAGEYLADALGVAAERLLELRLVKVIPLADPGAGNEIVAKVPGGTIWEVLSLFTTFSTSAAVANRRPILTFQDADNVTRYRIDATGVQAAGAVGRFSWLLGFGDNYQGSTQQMPLPSPPIPIPGGFKIVTVTALLDVGDAYSGTSLMVREWSETDVIQEAMLIDAQLSALTEREVTGR